MNKTRVWLCSSVFLAVFLLSTSAFPSNPGIWTVSIVFRETANGPTMGGSVTYPNCAYSPAYSGYCGHANGYGVGFVHAHTPSTGYPIPRAGDSDITATMTDWAWDAYYVNGQRISGANASKNCYAHVLGLDYWINSPDFMTYGWYEIDHTELSSSNCCSKPGDHAIKITGICNEGCSEYHYVAETHEKNGTSGVYKHTYYCPAGASLTNLSKR